MIASGLPVFLLLVALIGVLVYMAPRHDARDPQCKYHRGSTSEGFCTTCRLT